MPDGLAAWISTIDAPPLNLRIWNLNLTSKRPNLFRAIASRGGARCGRLLERWSG